MFGLHKSNQTYALHASYAISLLHLLNPKNWHEYYKKLHRQNSKDVWGNEHRGQVSISTAF